MTMFPHLLEARIQDARRKGKLDREAIEEAARQGPTSIPMEIVLMQEIRRLRQQLQDEEDPERRAGLLETLRDRRVELAMYHERAGRMITAAKL